MPDNRAFLFEEIHQFVDGLFNGALHVKRILSLANATPASSPAPRLRSARLDRNWRSPAACRPDTPSNK